jgi:hypothetical protein
MTSEDMVLDHIQKIRPDPSKLRPREMAFLVRLLVRGRRGW